MDITVKELLDVVGTGTAFGFVQLIKVSALIILVKRFLDVFHIELFLKYVAKILMS